MTTPSRISFSAWNDRYEALHTSGLLESWYGGSLKRHVCDGNTRLERLSFDNSEAALRLWNFLLTEEERLNQAKREGKKIIGTMKDLGTIPVLAYSFPNLVAFYPDGAWWVPCMMEQSDGLFARADALGVDESFCPVRAMLGAFQTDEHFPEPDLLICSTGAVCDDFSAIAQRLESMGHPIMWWEIPIRREPEADEPSVVLENGKSIPVSQVQWVQIELERILLELERTAGMKLDESTLLEGIAKANHIRQLLRELRELVYGSSLCPMPALEMLIVEALSIHYCSDQNECLALLKSLLHEVQHRVKHGLGVVSRDAVRTFWVNPPADFRIMNLLEDCGARLCGADFMFLHALEPIPSGCSPIEALARTALTDPMIGSSHDRAERIYRDVQSFNAEAVVISRIPGASHCAWEGELIRNYLQSRFDIPIIEIEIPSLVDSMEATFCTRIEALVETVMERR